MNLLRLFYAMRWNKAEKYHRCSPKVQREWDLIRERIPELTDDWIQMEIISIVRTMVARGESDLWEDKKPERKSLIR